MKDTEDMEDKKMVQIPEEEYLKLLKNQKKEHKLGEDLISQGRPQKKEEKKEEKKETTSNEKDLRNPIKYSTVFDKFIEENNIETNILLEELPPIEIIKPIETPKDKNIVEKSVNNNKIKKKRRFTKLGKTLVISLIIIILGASSTFGLNHSKNNKKTESETPTNISVILVDKLDEILIEHNIDLNDIDNNIHLFSKDFIKKYLYILYLHTNNDPIIMNKLIQKMTDNQIDTFSSYLIANGFYYHPYENEIMFEPDYKLWEKEMEALTQQIYEQNQNNKGVKK